MNTKGECRSYSPFPLSLSFFVAFCRFLLTNVAICRLQSIVLHTPSSKFSLCSGLKFPIRSIGTLYFAFRKACARGFPSTPFTKCALIYQCSWYVRPAELSPTGFRHRPQGRFKPSGTMSVGADFLPRQSKQSMVATPLFCKQKSKPLTACF